MYRRCWRWFLLAYILMSQSSLHITFLLMILKTLFWILFSDNVQCTGYYCSHYSLKWPTSKCKLWNWVNEKATVCFLLSSRVLFKQCIELFKVWAVALILLYRSYKFSCNWIGVIMVRIFFYIFFTCATCLWIYGLSNHSYAYNTPSATLDIM